MPRMVALKRVYYPSGGRGGKEYQPGEKFDVDNTKFAESLRLVGKAKIVPDDPVQTTKTETREMTASDVDVTDTEQEPQTRRYRRRDMVAED